MKITVFGATGAIGQLLVEKALQDGFHVKAYIRNFSYSNQKLEIIKGELDDYEKIQHAVSGADAVISTLGPELVRHYKGTPILDGHKNIIRAMQDQKVLRLITLATPSVKFAQDRISIATVLPGISARFLYPDAYREITGIGRIVADSGLDWTIVRIIEPDDSSPTGKVTVSFGETKIRWAISREDIAGFMLKQVTDQKYIHSMPIIGK